MKTLNVAEALAALRGVVAVRGEDYRYEKAVFTAGGYSCGCGVCQNQSTDEFYAYFNEDGSPSCIVGCVLATQGVTKDQMGKYNIDETFNSELVRILRANGIIDVSHEASVMLREAQAEQDKGGRWGIALAFAEKIAGGEQ